MKVTEKAWLEYIARLRRVNDTAASKMLEYLTTHEYMSAVGRKAALDYAYAISTQYGEAATALACEMYDAMAVASGVVLPPAVPAETATYGDVAKAVNGSLKQTGSPEVASNAVGRLVKRSGVDTTMQNAIRDGAEWAWIPHGDTCAFCITLASNGWQKASRKALKNGHAEHIHANCDCTYAVRFDSRTEYAGYDPDVYLEQYRNAEGKTWQEKVNSMRRAYYQDNRSMIREQKRVAHARMLEYNNSLKRVREAEIKKLALERARLMTGVADNDGYIARQVAEGNYSIESKHQKYLQHVYGTAQYKNAAAARNRPQSYLIIDEDKVQNIINENFGLGTLGRTNDGKPLPHEYVTLDTVVGYYYERGERYPTKRVKIFYAADGAHIVPVKEK